MTRADRIDNLYMLLRAAEAGRLRIVARSLRRDIDHLEWLEAKRFARQNAKRCALKPGALAKSLRTADALLAKHGRGTEKCR